jgi:hypothetical protein
VAQGEVSIRVYLRPESKDKFKTACFLKGLNMSDVTAELIEEWLAKNAVDLPAKTVSQLPEDEKPPISKSKRGNKKGTTTS